MALSFIPKRPYGTGFDGFESRGTPSFVRERPRCPEGKTQTGGDCSEEPMSYSTMSGTEPAIVLMCSQEKFAKGMDAAHGLHGFTR